MSMLAVTMAIADDEQKCNEDKVCFDKSQVERWNKNIQEKKKHPCKPCPEPVVVEKEVEKKVIKHHIISVYMVRDVNSTSNSTQGSTATATTETKYQPGIQYQYQFNFGLVPEVGINIKGNPMFGLGYEF